MGKNIRDIKRHFEGKNDACLEVPWIVYFTKPCKYGMKCNFCCICVSNKVIFMFAVFWVPYGGKHAARRELSMPFYT